MNQVPSKTVKRVRFGHIHADHMTFPGALDAIAERVTHGRGGFVVTPNVDHVCLAEESETLRDAYAHAALSLVDGMPLLWLARMLGHPLPEKISGSDLVRPLLKKAAQKQWRVYFLGGVQGVGQLAADKLRAEIPGLDIVGIDSPPLGFERDPEQNAAVLARINAAKPHLILVALGCPKQELWMDQNAAAYGPALALGIGATLDFIAGKVTRAPHWMSQVGLEWVYRLFQEPKRMYQRYLVRDRAIGRIAWRMLMLPRQDRVFFR